VGIIQTFLQPQKNKNTKSPDDISTPWELSSPSMQPEMNQAKSRNSIEEENKLQSMQPEMAEADKIE
jgi:hypothetical protein